jgi:cytochrome P450
VLCAELGVDGSERRFFEEPSATIDDPRSTQDERMDALSSFADYVRAVIERKRARPGDDLLSHLLASGDLTEDELVGISLTLFGAGHAPLANMVSLSTFFLLCDGRRGWDEARRHLEAPPGLVEELLRYLTVVQTGSFTRTAVEDVELGDFAVRAGESVCVSFAAANRDPSKFPDPDRFDPSRQTKGHMAFGYGRHMCLGQHLARRELAVALRGLMEQFPTLRLVPDPTTVRVTAGEHPLYGVDELVVTW